MGADMAEVTTAVAVTFQQPLERYALSYRCSRCSALRSGFCSSNQKRARAVLPHDIGKWRHACIDARLTSCCSSAMKGCTSNSSCPSSTSSLQQHRHTHP